MEKKLKLLFDYQAFQKNKKLSAVTKPFENDFGNALTEEELDFVNAAGDTTAQEEPAETPTETPIDKSPKAFM